jgi:hypothetical protein
MPVKQLKLGSMAFVARENRAAQLKKFFDDKRWCLEEQLQALSSITWKSSRDEKLQVVMPWLEELLTDLLATRNMKS